MSRSEFVKRSLIFALSVFVVGFSIAAIARANLGTTPISSPNFVISLHTPLSLGGMTFIFNVLLIVLQWVLYTKEERRENRIRLFMQLPVTMIFALSIDLGTFLLNSVLPPDMAYLPSFALLTGGTVLLALGVSLEVTANIAMVSGEAAVKVISDKLHKNFGTVKVAFDLILVVLAVIFSLIFTGFSAIEGVREGTLIGALATGTLVRFMLPRLSFLSRWARGKAKSVPESAENASEELPAVQGSFCRVITIAREYGCGGRVVGKLLAERLNMAFYDSELIEMVSRESGLSVDTVRENEEPAPAKQLYEMVMQDYLSPVKESLSTQDALYVAQAKVVRRIAHIEDCVIVGRGADDILKDNPHCLNVFLYASFDRKIRFCNEHYHQAKDEAIATMQNTDRRRENHYFHYTGRHFADPRNYHLCLDVGTLGVERTVDLIVALLKDTALKPVNATEGQNAQAEATKSTEA